MAVTQNDVAREAGVTRSMVSYVISGNSDRSVAPETRQKILDAVKKLGYRPNKAAQALQQGDVGFASKKIGVVLSSEVIFLRPFYAEILAGIHTAAHEMNHQISFIRFFDELKNPVLFNSLIHEEEIGGLILLACDQAFKSEEDKILVSKIKERLERIVCVEWKMDGLSSVMFDRRETAEKACDYILSAGYTDVGYIGELDERVDGVRKSLSGKGISGEFVIGGAFDSESGYWSLQKCIDGQKPVPRALVCGSDEVAVGVLSCLHENGISVPQNVAVISIDNILSSAYTNPPLTTMNVQKKAMGERAVELIVSGAAKKDEDAVCLMLPSKIVQRKSC